MPTRYSDDVHLAFTHVAHPRNVKHTAKKNNLVRCAAILAASTLALTACAANESAASDTAQSLSGILAGGGASSQEAAVKAWTAGFQVANPGVTVNYDPAGSGAGRESFQAGAFDFAGSDRAFKLEEIGEGTFAGCAADSGIIELPTYISPIAVILSLEGVDSLNLNAATMASIFAGKITRWDDPAIAASNPGIDLPDVAISPVHRSDNSGTTENFVDYLSVAAPEVWTWEPDGVWPISDGEAAQGTSGVIAAVTGGNGLIGYADASRAADADLSIAAVEVGGDYVKYSPEAAAAVVDESPFEEERTEGDLAIALERTPHAEGVYPIVLVSYMIACEKYEDPSVAALVKPFLEYVASPEGQTQAAGAAGNAPISDALRERVNAAIALIG